MKTRALKTDKVEEIFKLSKLKIGERAIVVKLNNTNRVLRRRLLDMGITRGVEIQIKKFAPLGDPIDISLRGYELCLRKADLEQIEGKRI